MKSSAVGFCAAAIVAMAASGAFADLHVVQPDSLGDFETIQEAINAAASGDTIELTDGTFTGDGNRDIDYGGKTLVVRSQSGDPELCVIDCEGGPGDWHNGFWFHSYEAEGSVLEGVTITNGYCVDHELGWPYDEGGGLRFTHAASVAVRNCILMNNEARVGAAVYLQCPTGYVPTFSDCVISNSTPDAPSGPAMLVVQGSTTFDGCEFTDNNCRAVCLPPGYSFAFSDCTISRNTGSGIRCGGSDLVLSDCVIRGNTGGSGVEFGDGVTTLTDCIISGNSTTTDGGGLWCGGTADTVRVTRCTINGNSAGGSGGGIWAQHMQSAFFTACTIDSNQSTTEGGGVYWVGEASPLFTDCRISSNQSGSGGGFACGGGYPSLVNCTLASNQAPYGGGFFSSTLSSSPSFSYCTFWGNVAAVSGGAALCDGWGTNTFSNCTFVMNRASEVYPGVGQGAAILGRDTGVALENCIVAYCSGGEAVHEEDNLDVEVACTDIYGNEYGDWTGCLAPFAGIDGNISSDPGFCNMWEGALSLREGSSCSTEESWTCGLIGAHPVACGVADFVGEPVLGFAPLTVEFEDRTSLRSPEWRWDFQDDGVVDTLGQDPTYTFAAPGSYTVALRVYEDGEVVAVEKKPDYVLAISGNTMVIRPIEIVSTDPTGVPFEYAGTDSLGAVSLYIDYDDTELTFEGIETYVPGEVFSAGVVGDQVSVQWFDETGGSDPIVPGVDPDTLFALQFTADIAGGVTRVEFDDEDCLLADPIGAPLPEVTWVDTLSYGLVTINVGALVHGDVSYYWEDAPIPNAHLWIGHPNPDVWSDALGHYQFERYPHGDYVLRVDKSDDVAGINSLDAVKVIRHSTGVEPFGDPYKETAADVNGIPGINALDAIKIVRAAVALEDLPSGDWAFDPDSLVLAPLGGDVEADFLGIRMGDVNGDWAPDGRSSAPRDTRDSLSLAFPHTTVVIGDEPSQVPVMTTGFDGITAISLRVTFASSLLDYTGTTSAVPGVGFTSNLVGDEIRIEWFDPTGGASPVSIGSDTLLTVGFELLGSEGDSSALRFTSACALGDSAGNPIADATYVDGSATLSGGSTGFGWGLPTETRLGDNFPNPFNPSTQIAFDIAAPGGRVTLRIYDAAGRLVRILVDRDMTPGRYVSKWDGTNESGLDVSSGVYLCRLSVAEATDQRKMVLLK